MDKFCEIFLAEKFEDQPDSYLIYYGKRIEKNVTEYIIDKTCKKEIESARKMPIEEALEEAQRRLIEFEEI